MSDIPIVRHVKVKGTSSPDDPKLTEYWEKRRTRYGNKYFARGSKLHKVAINQKWKCPVCTQHLFNGEAIETHHKIKVRDGGGNEQENLIHVHSNCHKHIHTGKQTVNVKA